MGSPPVLEHRAAYRVEELVDDEHRVEGEAPFGEPARSAHVDEHDDHIALDPRIGRSSSIGVHGRRVRGEHGHERDIACRAKLAGEPDPGSRVHPLEHDLLRGARGGELADVAKDADAAGGAAAASAAHMGMWDVVEKARLQHAQSARDADGAAGIGQFDRAAATLTPPAEASGQDRGGERRGERRERAGAIVQEDSVLRRGSDAVGGHVAAPATRDLEPTAASARRPDNSRAARAQAEARRSKEAAPLPTDRTASAAAKNGLQGSRNPDDQQENCLQHSEKWRADPEFQQLLRIALLEPEHAERNAGADHMIGQQERN